MVLTSPHYALLFPRLSRGFSSDSQIRIRRQRCRRFFQFLSDCRGAGIRPPRRMKTSELPASFTRITGPDPRRPPNSSSSPTFFPIAGITRTAVVFEFTIPIAASSAMIADTVAGEISPGTIIISRPTEQTAVIASSFSIVSTPERAASIIPASSETGMNAPESPPT